MHALNGDDGPIPCRSIIEFDRGYAILLSYSSQRGALVNWSRGGIERLSGLENGKVIGDLTEQGRCFVMGKTEYISLDLLHLLIPNPLKNGHCGYTLRKV